MSVVGRDNAPPIHTTGLFAQQDLDSQVDDCSDDEANAEFQALMRTAGVTVAE
jgi:hypothetical protein